MKIRKALFVAGDGDRLNIRRAGTRIYIVFVAPKVAVFYYGCLWHGSHAHGTQARRNAAVYSDTKAVENVERDRAGRTFV